MTASNALTLSQRKLRLKVRMLAGSLIYANTRNLPGGKKFY